MALRLSAAATEVAATPAPHAVALPTQPGAAGTRLRLEARAALAARDVHAYSALFPHADEIEDIHRRHQARLGLLEAGLHESPADLPVLAGAMAVVARRAIELLEAEPREPGFLNVAGVAFYELGELGAAERLFQAARRLDPDLAHVANNLDQLQARRRARLQPPPLPPAVRAAMRDLAPRGKRVAAAARPAEGLTLSLCMIVKDEEEMLPRCLAAVRDAVDELVIVDTGSKDRTREIALEFGAKLIDFEWTGSFSDARNVSFDAATGDWLMFLDADEVLVEGDGDRLRALTGQTWREAHYLLETNHTGTLEDGTAVTHNALRVFRNRPGLRFEGRIHEQIAQHLPAYLPERLAVSDVRIDHYGYLGAVRDAKEKSRRNIELLERQVAEGLDSPFLAFNLGSEYAAAGDTAAALEKFESAWRRVRDDQHIATYGFVPSLAGRLVRALRVTGHLPEARTRGEEVLRIFPRFTDVLLEQAIAAATMGDHATAVTELERCLEWGDAPSTYSATKGSGTYLAMATLADVKRTAGDLEGAEELLRRCRTEHPLFLGAIEPLTRLLIARGRTPEEAVAAAEADGELPLSARFMLAAALHESGASEAAEEQLGRVLDAQPDAAPAHVALGEALLSQSRFVEAADAARSVDPASPWAPAAARTAVFGLLAAEADDDDVRDGLAWAREAGLPEGEARAMEAWMTARSGAAPEPASVPAGAAPFTLTMLEALLRLQAFELFAQLLPVIDALALSTRDRHEQLARMYLRRGFLESAGDEWVAAIQENGPDVAALMGLSQVAAARGLDEDAELLAGEARALATA
jgi:glycosyltransferase involved in cell wall biosynthesis/Flp pilus assembly protein TadD